MTTEMKPRTSRSSQLVIGAAVGYSFDQILPFLQSLYLTGYQGRALIIADASLAREIQNSKFSENTDSLIVKQWIPFKLKLFSGWRKRWRVKYLWLPIRFFLWSLLRASLHLPAPLNHAIKRKLAYRLLAPTETRFIHAYDYLKENPVEQILLSDIRDVLFQSNPFDTLPSDGLSIGIENFSPVLRNQPHNRRWIKLTYGPEILKKIGDNQISCSGVTFGDYQAIQSYLLAMCSEIFRYRFAATSTPLDQAPHNFLIWTGTIAHTNALQTGSSPLATLSAAASLDAVDMDQQGQLRNTDGSIISIIHMYDRWPDISKALLTTLKNRA